MACYVLSGPSTSGQEELDKENKLSSDEELESCQRSPIRERCQEPRKQCRPSKQSQFNNNATALETKIIKSEESSRKIKAYADKKTCPEVLGRQCQVDIICEKVSAGLGALKRIRPLVPSQTRL